MRPVLFILLSWGINSTCYGQKLPAILKFIHSYHSEISHIFSFSDSSGFARVIPEIPGNYARFSNNGFIKTSNGIFLQPGGTGRVYKIDFAKMALTRMDSTRLEGYNWGALTFSFNDTIYSLGGYGFWRNNGHLRFYRDVSNEWEVKPLESELPIGNWPNRLWWLDKRNGKLYVCQGLRDSINEGIVNGYPKNIEPNNKGSVFELDLKEMQWKELGEVSKYGNLIGGMPIGMSPWGLLVENDARNYVICDFSKNRIYNVPSVFKKIKVRAEHLKGYSFFVDSEFFYGDVYKNTFDSFTLSPKDLIYAGEAFYIKKGRSPNISLKNVLFGCAIGVCLLGLFLFWRMRKFNRGMKSTKVSNLTIDTPIIHKGKPETATIEFSSLSEEENNQSGSAYFPLGKKGFHLTEVEKSLIKLLVAMEKKRQMANVHDLDRVLGVAGKPESTRKKIRSDTISSINQKVSIRLTKPMKQIESRRSEFDKRIFEYYIPSNQVKEIDELCFDF